MKHTLLRLGKKIPVPIHSECIIETAAKQVKVIYIGVLVVQGGTTDRYHTFMGPRDFGLAVPYSAESFRQDDSDPANKPFQELVKDLDPEEVKRSHFYFRLENRELKSDEILIYDDDDTLVEIIATLKRELR